MAENVKTAPTKPAELEQAAIILADARDQVIHLLGEKYGTLALGLETKLNLMVNQLGALSPTRSVEVKSTFKKVPVTNFMGEELKTAKPIKDEDLTPEQLERKNFVAKIEKLEASFDELSDDQILESYKVEPNVVRGVAKRAGLEDYREAEFNLKFIQDIRVGRKAQKEDREKLKADREATNLIDGADDFDDTEE